MKMENQEKIIQEMFERLSKIEEERENEKETQKDEIKKLENKIKSLESQIKILEWERSIHKFTSVRSRPKNYRV